MWNNEDDVNEKGDAVTLYLPNQGPPRRINVDTVESHIGGMPNGQEPPPCANCNNLMFLLAQVKRPNQVNCDGSKVDRTVTVFGCPRTACFGTLKFKNGFCSGGQGIFSCRINETQASVPTKATAPVAPTKSSWYTDSQDDDDNEWGISTDDSTGGIENLESAVAAMEGKLQDGAIVKERKPTTLLSPKIDEKKTSNASMACFPCFMLTQKMEPFAPKKSLEEDDVGLSASDDKIRNMLARYMAEEEDEEILAALQGTSIGGGVGEEDERLTEEDRTLLGFQDRLRRVPRQVIRYARGGVPLWSIPSTKKGKPLWTIPTCAKSGKQMTFEMQLLPSLQHVLEVDKYADGEEKTQDGSAGIGDLLSTGMNWGSVAIFTDSDTSGESTNGYLVIQETVDERPDLPEGYDARDFTPVMAVVEDMDDDDEFEPFKN